MTLLFADGCDSGLNRLSAYGGSVSFNPTAGVYGGGAIEIASGGNYASYIQKVFTPTGDTSNPTTRFSFWMKTNATVTTESFFIQTRQYQSTSSDYSFSSVFTDGKISTWQWDNSFHGTIVRPLAYPRLDDGNWHHLAFRVKYAGSGLYALTIDGIYNFSYSLDFTGSGVSDAVLFDALTLYNFRNGTVWYDDILIWNEYDIGDNFSGRIGPTRIFTVRPDADDQIGSTASSGTDRYLMINEPTLVTANYVTLSTGTRDIYQTSNVANISGTILGAQASILFNASLPGYTANLRPVVISNGVTQNGNVSTSVTRTIQEATIRVNKDFGNSNTAWTEATINDLKIGFENTG